MKLKTLWRACDGNLHSVLILIFFFPYFTYGWWSWWWCTWGFGICIWKLALFLFSWFQSVLFPCVVELLLPILVEMFSVWRVFSLWWAGLFLFLFLYFIPIFPYPIVFFWVFAFFFCPFRFSRGGEGLYNEPWLGGKGLVFLDGLWFFMTPQHF